MPGAKGGTDIHLRLKAKFQDTAKELLQQPYWSQIRVVWIEDEKPIRMSVLKFLLGLYDIADEKKAIRGEFKSQNWRITPEASSHLGIPFVILGESDDLELAIIQDAARALQATEF